MKKLLALLLALAVSISMTACGNNNNTEETTTVETTVATTEEQLSDKISDRLGNEYDKPEKVDIIVSGAPSVTEILSGLGLGSNIVAADQWSAGIEGLKVDFTQLDMMNLDMETIINLKPDVVFLDSINYVGQEDKYKPLTDAGVNVIVISSQSSLDDIMKDVQFVGQCTGTEAKAKEMVADMNKTIEDVKSKVAVLSSNPPKVYFETSPPDYLATAGSGTFIDDIIKICGGENIFSDMEGWPLISDEAVLEKNPDIIITNCDWDSDSVANLKARDGWNVIEAVKNDKVFLVSANETSRGSQHIVDGLMQVARAMYPDLFE